MKNKEINMESFNDYPQSVKDNAKRGIELNEKNSNKCATQVGKVRAQQLAKGEPISMETIKRMYSYLSRAETYYKGADENECGYISYLLWGGPEAITWSKNKLDELEQIDTKSIYAVLRNIISKNVKEKESIDLKKWRSTPNSSNVNKILYNDETKEMVIKFNGGDLYTYFDVDFSEFTSIFQGVSVARTSGKSKWGTWNVGKTPSVGAAVYNLLVKTRKKHKKGGSLK